MMYLRPKLSYPLPCTSYTPAQCPHIQAPALAALLPKLRLNRDSPRVIIFSGPKYGGLGLPDMMDDQGYGQLLLFIGHVKLGDDNGKLILSMISHMQLGIGTASPILSLPFPIFEKWIEYNWITSVWSYVSSAKATIEIQHQWVPKISRQGDSMIIDQAMEFNFTADQLKQINRCRMYLNVLTISDILMANGRYILKDALDGHQIQERRSTLNWLCSIRPHNWSSWKRLLLHLSSV